MRQGQLDIFERILLLAHALVAKIASYVFSSYAHFRIIARFTLRSNHSSQLRHEYTYTAIWLACFLSLNS
jgi:hypothetical protein